MSSFEDVAENSDILGTTARNYKRNILIICAVILGISFVPGIDVEKARLFGMTAKPVSAKAVLSIFLLYLTPSYAFYAWRDFANWKASLGQLTKGFYAPIFADVEVPIEELAFKEIRGLSEAKDIVIKRGEIDTRFRVIEEYTSFDEIKNQDQGKRKYGAYDMPIETWTAIVRGRQFFMVLNVCLPAVLTLVAVGALVMCKW